MPITPTNLIDQLVRDEGEVLHAYQDSLGFWTIGSGILIDPRKGGGITHEENLYLLGNRAEKARAYVRTQFPWTLSLDEVRRAALENMAFNMGAHLGEFRKFLAHLEAREYEDAAKEMVNSVWAIQTGPRAHRLAEQIRTGEWV